MPSVRGSWTTCTPCSQKSHVHPSHTVVLSALLSCCFNLYNSQLHLSVSLSAPRAARACSFSVSRCGCLGRRNSRGRGEFQCIQLGYWVDVCLAVPASPYFHVGNTNILWVSRFWWCRHIQIDFHTFHFSFLLTFCTCFFSFLSTSLSQPSTVCSHS